VTTISDDIQGAIAFHGHYCPGLTIGFRAAQIAMRELGVTRAADEELVAICETDACGVDAIQFLTGCTIGKGNLILRDWGKQVLTLGRRSDDRMVRVALRFGAMDGLPTEDRDERRRLAIERLHNAPEAELYDVRWVAAPMPEKARIFRSVRCSACGEGVMEARAHLRAGDPVCPECYGAEYSRRA
jgi:formylmethanofuran dehydrogenase subunit E